jgi:hypothetical protein
MELIEEVINTNEKTDFKSSTFNFKQTKLVFTNNPFNYEIEYDEYFCSLHIQVMHNSEFLCWSIVISEDLTDRTSDSVFIKLTPLALF